MLALAAGTACVGPTHDGGLSVKSEKSPHCAYCSMSSSSNLYPYTTTTWWLAVLARDAICLGKECWLGASPNLKKKF